MPPRFFNTLSRSVQPFFPRDPQGKRVGLYCCGPTVHDFAHIGNFRTFVFADLVRRHLEASGFEVRHVMNITDVEDKIIARIRQAGTSLQEFTRQFERAFLEDHAALGCLKPHVTPRATEYVQEILELIQKLLDQGVAYQAPDRSVYFSIDRYRGCGCRYGQLVQLDFEEMRPGERVSRDEYAKESVADFALWKARVPEDGPVFWPSPWGEGRPGWHIECSAMSMKCLGPSFDLHLGGEDLMFPHHEDEIAQSEGARMQAPGEPFVKYWMHGAHLLVEGKKMAKSLGNFFTLRDLLAKGFSGREIRFLLLSAHYRESFNFTLDGLKGAQAALSRLDDCLRRVAERAGGGQPPERHEASPILVKFRAALDDDLNVSAAWGVVFEWVAALNRSLAEGTLAPESAREALANWGSMDAVLGVGRAVEAEAPPEFQALLEERQSARKARDFKRSDAIRDELKTQGWAIEDTPQGPRLKKL